MKKSLALFVFVPFLAWCSEFSKNTLIIQFSKDANTLKSLEDIKAKSFEFLDSKNGPLIASFDDSIDIETRLKKILENPQIKAQLNFKYTIQGELLPNDPLLKNQWEHQNPQIQKVWNETTNCQKKIVAVLDTGINFSHADLKESIHPTSYNAINPDETANDYNGHGTLMASIIGAKGDNSKGVSGICWATKIMAIKVLNDLGEGFSSDIIKGINFAQKNHASILNLSFGSYSGEDFFLKGALEKFLSKGLIAIVPAGNNGLDIEKEKFWPCSFKLKGMLCVASTTKEGNLADFSNFSGKDVDLAAPGDNIYGIAPGSYQCTTDEKKPCLSSGNENEVQWAKKDFTDLISTFDFSYIEFSAKGKIKLLINQQYSQEISGEESKYFLDLNECQEKKQCVLEFLREDGKSKVAIWDFKIWGLKLGNQTYQRKYGSSLSAAYVSALAALIGTYNPKFSAVEIIESIKKGSKNSKNLKGKIEGSRLVDPWGQLKFLAKPKW